MERGWRRRDVLWQAMTLGLYASGCRLASTPSRSRDERVVVIGAGIAGLAVARTLKAEGFDVLVVEARARLGGRIWTHRNLGVPIDLGASWIEGSDNNPLTELSASFGIETAVTDFQDVMAWDHDGRKLPTEKVREIQGWYPEIEAAIETVAGHLDRDISVGEAVALAQESESLTAFERRAVAWLLAVLTVETGVDLKQMSVRYVGDDAAFNGAPRMFPGGYAQIIDGLADGLDIRRSTPVETIDMTERKVRVITPQGTEVADRVVVTIPLGPLAQGAVTFRPALPSRKQSAIGQLAMGVLDKIVLRFDKRFWPKGTFYGYVAREPDRYPIFLDFADVLGTPVLMGFTGGAFARSMERKTDRAVRAETMTVLRTMFGTSIPAPTGFVRARWGQDPFSLGSYSYVPVQATSKAYDHLAEPVDDRLFFAGEATNRAYRATVHGAYLSGLREAKRIAQI